MMRPLCGSLRKLWACRDWQSGPRRAQRAKEMPASQGLHGDLKERSPSAGWHIVTSEYPPDVGGVSDYTRQIAEALVQEGEEVHVWCPPSQKPRAASRVHIHTEPGRFRPADLTKLTRSLDTFPSPRRLLVQWVPHGFGYRSMNVWFCLWVAATAAKGHQVELMVHEPFIELKRGALRHIAMAVVHRLMTIVLMWSAHRVWVAIPAWEPRLRPYTFGRRVRIDWLPIPAGVTAMRGATRFSRSAFVDHGRPIVGHFGSYGHDVSKLLMAVLPALIASATRPSLLLIGARSDTFRTELIARYPAWSTRVHATGYVDPAELTGYLEVCDLFLQPYPDGITSRRTSAMACLALGLPVVTTSGHLTEPLWAESGAVALADVADPTGFATAAVRLLELREERQRLGQHGQQLYREQFSLDRAVDALMSRDRAHVSLPSCA
jgi:glycosyltransferase involved in cell wall biosynthesis